MAALPSSRSTLRQWLLSSAAVVAIGAGVTISVPAYADFAQGAKAYEKGDYSAAYRAWLPLARAGDAAAQRNIGQLYRLGQGVPKDLAVAANWYRLAAEQGLARAQANLGVMYLRGEGVAQDHGPAANWFLKAAEQGHAISQYNLALLYEQGLGVERNRTKAVGWLQRAAEGGHDPAGEQLAQLLNDKVAPAAGPPAGGPARPADAVAQAPVEPARPGSREGLPPMPAGDAKERSAEVARVAPPAPAGPRDRSAETMVVTRAAPTQSGSDDARLAVTPPRQPDPQIAALPKNAPPPKAPAATVDLAKLRPAPGRAAADSAARTVPAKVEAMAPAAVPPRREAPIKPPAPPEVFIPLPTFIHREAAGDAARMASTDPIIVPPSTLILREAAEDTINHPPLLTTSDKPAPAFIVGEAERQRAMTPPPPPADADSDAHVFRDPDPLELSAAPALSERLTPTSRPVPSFLVAEAERGLPPAPLPRVPSVPVVLAPVLAERQEALPVAPLAPSERRIGDMAGERGPRPPATQDLAMLPPSPVVPTADDRREPAPPAAALADPPAPERGPAPIARGAVAAMPPVPPSAPSLVETRPTVAPPLAADEVVLGPVAPLATRAGGTWIPDLLRREAEREREVARAAEEWARRSTAVESRLSTYYQRATADPVMPVPAFLRAEPVTARLRAFDDIPAPLFLRHEAESDRLTEPTGGIHAFLKREAMEDAITARPRFVRPTEADVRRQADAVEKDRAVRADNVVAKVDRPPVATLDRNHKTAVENGIAAYLARDYAKALQLWEPAAEGGDPDAQFFLGGLYQDGLGVARSLVIAHVWFSRAVLAGHARAPGSLAMLRRVMTEAQYAEAVERANKKK
ncbi:MAG: hypothetical protein EXQ85_00430 [Alphaproteobacteria bacterium]|nr:hypothetical protein [Alphaproteobacteria bacterium]